MVLQKDSNWRDIENRFPKLQFRVSLETSNFIKKSLKLGLKPFDLINLNDIARLLFLRLEQDLRNNKMGTESFLLSEIENKLKKNLIL